MMRPAIDNQPPKPQPHLTMYGRDYYAKKKATTEAAFSDLKMIQTIARTMTRPFELCPRQGPVSLNATARKQELFRITMSNHQLLNSLEQLKPVVTTRDLLKSYHTNERHTVNCSHTTRKCGGYDHLINKYRHENLNRRKVAVDNLERCNELRRCQSAPGFGSMNEDSVQSSGSGAQAQPKRSHPPGTKLKSMPKKSAANFASSDNVHGANQGVPVTSEMPVHDSALAAAPTTADAAAKDESANAQAPNSGAALEVQHSTSAPQPVAPKFAEEPVTSGDIVQESTATLSSSNDAPAPQAETIEATGVEPATQSEAEVYDGNAPASPKADMSEAVESREMSSAEAYTEDEKPSAEETSCDQDMATAGAPEAPTEDEKPSAGESSYEQDIETAGAPEAATEDEKPSAGETSYEQDNSAAGAPEAPTEDEKPSAGETSLEQDPATTSAPHAHANDEYDEDDFTPESPNGQPSHAMDSSKLEESQPEDFEASHACQSSTAKEPTRPADGEDSDGYDEEFEGSKDLDSMGNELGASLQPSEPEQTAGRTEDRSGEAEQSIGSPQPSKEKTDEELGDYDEDFADDSNTFEESAS